MEVSVLKTMFSCALKWQLIESNPVAAIEKLKEKPKRDVFLTREQAAALVKALPRMLGLIVKFAIYTGLRKDNILSMTIGQINFTDGVIRLTVKGDKSVTHPLSENALAAVRDAIGERKEGLVFPAPDGRKYNATLTSFAHTVDKLGLRVGNDRLHFHDLRHVYGTWLAEAGVSLDMIRWLMHHEKRSTTDRYVSVKNSALTGLSDMIPTIPED
jgi:integrase